jgi:hypothetical protein
MSARRDDEQVPAFAGMTRPRAKWDWLRLLTLGLCIALTWPAVRYVGAGQATRPQTTASDAVIYSGGLTAGWQDWSWAGRNLRCTEVTLYDRPTLKMEPAEFRGLYLHRDGLDTTGFQYLSLWVNGGRTGGQRIAVCAVDAKRAFGPKADMASFTVSKRIPARQWTAIMIPLRRLKANDRRITGFSFQDSTGKAQGAIYFAEIRLTGRLPLPSKPYTVTIDTEQDVHAISPFIYGMASAPPPLLRELKIGCNRWGGNPNSRYNWERGNCWNAARDWEFRNGNYGVRFPEGTRPSGAADNFIAGNRAAGVATLLTIPTIGYVARDDNNATRSLNVPRSGGLPVAPGSEAIKGYDPSENQQRTSVKSYARKGKSFQDPPALTDDAVYQDEWVYHLVRKFGKASEGGVRFYAMDNEPDLWDVTHTDIHPAAMGYDDLLANFLEYAAAVKAVDPTALVTGPVSWGWTGCLYSPRDRVRRDWNGRPDRRAHGDMEFISWFLDQARRHDRRTGRRTLDVLDIHFYPQGAGVYGGSTDPQTNALRLRSTRVLWDPNYTDESWIAERVTLIPRMKAWINRYYPGTKLGLTEWNWGAGGTMNGALATAECLGIFGREGLYLANLWTSPGVGTPAYFAFKMYLNADGAGHGFGDRSVRAVSSAPDDISCFASVDGKTGEPVAILLNKQPGRDSIVTVRLRHGRPLTRASLWRYSEENRKAMMKLPDVAVSNGALKLTLPAYSMTLARFRSRE